MQIEIAHIYELAEILPKKSLNEKLRQNDKKFRKSSK